MYRMSGNEPQFNRPLYPNIYAQLWCKSLSHPNRARSEIDHKSSNLNGNSSRSHKQEKYTGDDGQAPQPSKGRKQTNEKNVSPLPNLVQTKTLDLT